MALLRAGQAQTVPCQCLVPYSRVTVSPQGRQTRPRSQRRDFTEGKGDARAAGASGAGGASGFGGTRGCACAERKEQGVSRGPAEAASPAFPHSTTHCRVTWLTPTLQPAAGKVQKPQAHSHPAGRHGVRDVGCKVWDEDGGDMGSGCGVQDAGLRTQCRIGRWGAGHLVQDQDVGAGCGFRIRL